METVQSFLLVDIWQPIAQFLSDKWQSAKPPDLCDVKIVAAVTLVTSVAASNARLHGDPAGPIQFAELGIDLSAAALAMALTVPATFVLCHLGSTTKTDVSLWWMAVTPVLAWVTLRAANYLFLAVNDFVDIRPKKASWISCGICSVAFAVLVLCSFFLTGWFHFHVPS